MPTLKIKVQIQNFNFFKDKTYYEIKSKLTDWRKLFDQAKYLKSNWNTPKYQMNEFRGHKKG